MNTITIGNFKGGVGKTTTSVMLAFLLNYHHKKTLVIDFDPQSNATEILSKTYNFDSDDTQSVIQSMTNGDLTSSIIHANDYLDLIPADWQLSLFPEFLDNFNKDMRMYVLRKLLEPIKDNYDYILIDTPPTISQFSNNAILASDYVLMVMQSQQQCYSSTIKYGAYIQRMHNDYDNNIDIAGINPYLVKRRGLIDAQIIADAKVKFGSLMFKNTIYSRERIKRYGRNGIKSPDSDDFDFHDKEVFDMYDQVFKEMEERINKGE